MILTLQDSIIRALLASGIPGIDWSVPNVLAFNETPEPPPPYPYVVLEVPESTKGQAFERAYVEEYDPVVYVVAVQRDVVRLGSPYAPGSVTQYLEQFEDNPRGLSGDYFECDTWLRKGWHLAPDQSKARAPDGQRVWIASILFHAMLTVPYRVWGKTNG